MSEDRRSYAEHTIGEAISAFRVLAPSQPTFEGKSLCNHNVENLEALLHQFERQVDAAVEARIKALSAPQESEAQLQQAAA